MRPFFLLFIFWSCSQTNAQTELTIKDVKFDGIFGSNELDSTSVYCLLGMGYFRAPSSDNIDSVIATWIDEHPNAIVKPIYSSGPALTSEPDSRMTYCWVIDGTENLNLWLAEQGCTHGMNFQYPTKKVKKQLGMTGKDFKPQFEKVHVNKKEYEEFIELAQLATNIAFENKRGVWKDP